MNGECRKVSAMLILTLTATVSGAASAHGGNNDPNVVHACIHNRTGLVRIVDPGAPGCIVTRGLAEYAAHWGIEGPQGIQGEDGEQGIQGPQGPAGRHSSWGAPITAPAERFTLLASSNDEAVLDNETGLVWERNPLHPQPDVIGSDTGFRPWPFALHYCATKEVGGRFGWRLPSVQELLSLVDSGGDGFGRELPAGHPFANTDLPGEPPPFGYWTATTYLPLFPIPEDSALVVEFATRTSNDAVTVQSKTDEQRVWCVRGGSGPDAQ
jgi:hypothetical protein